MFFVSYIFEDTWYIQKLYIFEYAWSSIAESTCLFSNIPRKSPLAFKQESSCVVGDDDDDYNDDDDDNDESGQQRERWSHDGMR